MSPAPGKVLVATRTLADPGFGRTVVLLFEADGSGALGVVLNRPSRFSAGALLPRLVGSPQGTQRAYSGGPVQRDRIFVLVRRTAGPAEAVQVLPGLWLATRGEALELALTENWPETRWRALYGYAGWGPGQLDAEIARGDWHVRDADAATLMETPPGALWGRLEAGEGGQWALVRSVEPARSVRVAGHADADRAGVHAPVRIFRALVYQAD